MDIRATISERLLSEAADSVPAQARELEKAARKIASYSRAPGNRKQADRITPVLTAAASHLGHQPETEADVWARQLSLDLPKEYWQIWKPHTLKAWLTAE